MTKLGRHLRTIRLPDEETWQLPPPPPAERGQPVRKTEPAPEETREPVPSRR